MNDKEYKKWEMQVEKTEKHNNELLVEFANYLETESLKTKTIKKHVDNISFYANDFLLRDDIIPAERGALDIGGFLGDFFIRKCSWASRYTIQENIASFKKFYTFLNTIGKVSNDELSKMKELIKDGKSYWIEEVERYWDNVEECW